MLGRIIFNSITFLDDVLNFVKSSLYFKFLVMCGLLNKEGELIYRHPLGERILKARQFIIIYT